jgi:hypothetical protein
VEERFMTDLRGLEAPEEVPGCGSCEYGREAPASARIGSGRLACCRGSPAISVVDARQLMPAQHERLAWWVWPLVEADWWCGEYLARPVVNPLDREEPLFPEFEE